MGNEQSTRYSQKYLLVGLTLSKEDLQLVNPIQFSMIHHALWIRSREYCNLQRGLYEIRGKVIGNLLCCEYTDGSKLKFRMIAAGDNITIPEIYSFLKTVSYYKESTTREIFITRPNTRVSNYIVNILNTHSIEWLKLDNDFEEILKKKFEEAEYK
jgi:hypothetical protein